MQLRNHPFRLLLYLEWILLGITILTEFPFVDMPPPPPPFPPDHFGPQSSLLTVVSISTFGIMGLRLPKGKLLSRIFYIGFGFGLILLAAMSRSRGVSSFPGLLLILVIRSCLIFGLTGRLIVSSLVFVFFLVTLIFPVQNIHVAFSPPLTPDLPTPISPPPPRPIPLPAPPEIHVFRREISQDQAKVFFLNLTLNIALLFGLVLGFVLLLVNAVLAERQTRQKLVIANQQLQQYAQRIEDQAILQERNRIAREIHDSLGHSLTAQSIQLENALMFLPSNVEKAQSFVAEAKRLGKDALKEVRQSIATLRSNPLQEQSLEDAIASLVKDFQGTTGIVPEYKSKLASPLPIEMNTAIYRITKEALANIYKHSEATQVKIRLLCGAEGVYLRVEDNGKGFHPNHTTTGFGLQGMRERALALGGELNIISKLGEGCRIMAYIPCPTLYANS